MLTFLESLFINSFLGNSLVEEQPHRDKSKEGISIEIISLFIFLLSFRNNILLN